ncbi:MAG TPA: polysaccharide deacetylase family protein [Pyrinomonadaceae bacterium]|jgi:peptidoglycan/xylan/chitin deacetylase (PgdA/CDA1 family)
MLKEIKKAALSSLRALGAFSVVRDSGWRRRRLLILAYHGVSLDDEHLWDDSLYMSPDCFGSRMRALAESGAAVLPLGEAVERLYANDLPDRSVALTFDDGHHDFYARAFPVIREFGFPVTLYLTTFYSNFNRPVFDTFCSYLLWKGRGRRLDAGEWAGRALTLDLSTGAGRARASELIRRSARERRLSAEEKDATLVRLAGLLGVDYGELAARRILHILRPEDARRLAEAGVDVQLHTHRHRAPLDRDLFRREIMDNRESIRAMTGSEAAHFCYPSGSYDGTFLPWLEELGVASAMTCDVGYASRDSERLLLPRLLDVSSLSRVEFEAWLAGVAAALPRRRVGATG